MTETDIRRLDLTLLMVLASLLRTRHATSTAQELGVTQSSVSHSLAKLRDVFGDELFVRRPQGLEPTARARGLELTIMQIIDLTRLAVRSRPFDPAVARGLIRIAGSDYPCTLLAAPLLQRLEKEAPNLSVSFRPLVRQKAIAGLASGDLDFAIGPFIGDVDRFEKRLLWEDGYCVAVRKSHPVFKDGCTLSDYASARHVLVSQSGDMVGIVDSVLAAKNLERHVVAAAPYFLTALATVSRSDAITTMPSSIARAHAKDLGLRLFSCPVPIRPLKVNLLSSNRISSDPLNPWVAQIICDVAAKQVCPHSAAPRQRVKGARGKRRAV